MIIILYVEAWHFRRLRWANGHSANADARLAKLQTRTLIEMVNRILSFECNHSIFESFECLFWQNALSRRWKQIFLSFDDANLAYKRKVYANFRFRHGECIRSSEVNLQRENMREAINKQIMLFSCCAAMARNFRNSKNCTSPSSAASLFIFTVLKWHLVFIRALNVFELQDVLTRFEIFRRMKEGKVTANEIVEFIPNFVFSCGF